METHSCTLTTKPRIGEPLAIEAGCSKSIAVGSREGSQLCVGIQVLVPAQMSTLLLGMGGEATLVVWSCHSRPPAETPKLRWRHVVLSREVLVSVQLLSGASASKALERLPMSGSRTEMQ